MTKHTPATPLPFRSEFGEGRAFVVDAEGRDIAVIKGLASMDSKISAQRESDQAAYFAHAANAYPKLVEALRIIAAPFERADGKEFDRSQELTRALLRELGEDA